MVLFIVASGNSRYFWRITDTDLRLCFFLVAPSSDIDSETLNLLSTERKKKVIHVYPIAMYRNY